MGPTTQPDVPQQQHSSTFPQDLPPREQSWKQRNCPHMRTCWHFKPSSYSLAHCPDKRTWMRRIAMIVILLFRTAMSALSIFSAVRSGNIAAIVIYSILAVLSLWFIAWCLAVIGDAVGERKVLGVLIVRVDSFVSQCAGRSTDWLRRADGTLMASCTAVQSYMRS